MSCASSGSRIGRQTSPQTRQPHRRRQRRSVRGSSRESWASTPARRAGPVPRPAKRRLTELHRLPRLRYIRRNSTLASTSRRSFSEISPMMWRRAPPRRSTTGTLPRRRSRRRGPLRGGLRAGPVRARGPQAAADDFSAQGYSAPQDYASPSDAGWLDDVSANAAASD